MGCSAETAQEIGTISIGRYWFDGAPTTAALASTSATAPPAEEPILVEVSLDGTARLAGKPGAIVELCLKITFIAGKQTWPTTQRVRVAGDVM